MVTEDVLARLARLERSNRRLKAGLALCLAAVAGAALLGFMVRPQSPREVQELLRVRTLEVVDANDTVRVRLGGDLPDTGRGQKAAGILLFDDSGRERSGYVTFENRWVALTLDTRQRQVATFAAGPDDGGYLRIWRPGRSDWVELNAGDTGARFTAGKDFEIVFQEPALAPEEAAMVCTGFKAELGQMASPPPADELLAACKRWLPESECRKCLGQR